jgi:hypothetical protein
VKAKSTRTKEEKVLNGFAKKMKDDLIEDLDRPIAKPGNITILFITIFCIKPYFIGTIADREHRKWTEKAIPLTNNPYSRENIERRLSKNSVISSDNGSVTSLASTK